MLLNKKNIIYLQCDREAESRDDVLIERSTYGPKYLYFRDWSDRGEHYWYVMFKTGIAFKHVPIEEYMDINVLNALKDEQQSVYLYLHNTHESFLSFVEDIYEYIVIPHNILPDKIIVANNAHELDAEVHRVAEKYQMGRLRCELVHEFEVNFNLTAQPRHFTDPPNDFEGTMDLSKLEKSFLCLNRRWRTHRPIMVSMLQKRGLLGKGFVSLGPSDDDQNFDKIWPWFLHLENKHESFRGQLASKEEMIALQPMYLDTEDLVTNRADFTWETCHYYTKSLFSVVNETNFFVGEHGHLDSQATFFSEKIYKPITHRHPFIVASTPQFLEALRTYGYQTFGEMIDESYDTIEDDVERMIAIVDEIERLCNLSETDQQAFIDYAKPIVDHNYNTMVNRTEYHYKKNYV